MSFDLHNQPIGVDDRMIGVRGTGVTAYASTLRALLPLLTDRPLILGADLPDGRGQRSRLRRFIAALRRGEREARFIETGSRGLERRICFPDLFREAQVHFNLYNRLLVVRPPCRGGIMHWTYPVPIRMAGWINVYTVHDAIPLVRPDLTPIDPRRHRRLLDRIVAVADRIVTVSDAARNEIVAALGCPAALVENVGEAVEVRGSPAALPAGLAPRRYLLVCGSIEPRKNIGRILDAYRSSGVTLPLVLAGPDGWRAAEFAAAIATTPGVLRLTWQTREQMDALLGSARALVMPSLAEGFGLPLVEAMARGTPAIVSGEGALAEVAGGAALLVNPLSIADIGAAMRRVAEDDALCARLDAAGRVRARSFAASAIAPRLARVYADLVALRNATPYRPA
ncbi:MAG: group 1 glycosyl transferase [Sphingomonas bacterium]|nr:group 1 glycosyl transferase [Sphingomonas bacterium]